MRIPESRPFRPLIAVLLASVVLLLLYVTMGAFAGDTGSLPKPDRERTAAVLILRDAPQDASPDAPLTFESWERQRIQRHLAEVEAEMRARDVSDLTAEQREAREAHLAALVGYRAAGVFPRNLGHPGEMVPYFVDDRGVLCAVGYLLYLSGFESLVQRIAEERNHATVPELADEPELVAWLGDAGITLEEAARIQPAYCNEPGCCGLGICWPEPEPEPDPSPTAYRAVSAGLLSVQGVALGWNLVSLLRGDTSGWKAGLALGAGTVGFGMGAHGVGQDHTRGLGLVNLGAGVATLAGGVVAYRARDRQPTLEWRLIPVVPSGFDPGPVGVLASTSVTAVPDADRPGKDRLVGVSAREGGWHPPFRVPALIARTHQSPAYPTASGPPDSARNR